MATKNLARTVLEGGRTGYEKFGRNYATRQQRRQTREYLIRVQSDPEYYLEEKEPERKKIFDGFTDKLEPVKRFLASRVDKSWPETKSLIKEKFDDRSLAGWHVVYQHIYRDIAPTINVFQCEYYIGFYDYYIDEENILRKVHRPNRKYKSLSNEEQTRLELLKREIIKWLDYRKIGFVDGVLYWFDGGGKDRVKITWDHYAANYLSYDGGYFPYEGCPDNYILRYRFNQSAKLTAEEVNYFRNLPEKFQKNILENSPTKKKKRSRYRYV